MDRKNNVVVGAPVIERSVVVLLRSLLAPLCYTAPEFIRSK